MYCPYCNAAESKVIDSRLVADGHQIRRRRECIKCEERFTTFESYHVVMPRVIKTDGRVEPFDEQKLRRSLTHALRKRPIDQESFETAVNGILARISRLGERDIRSRDIGENVMQSLYQLDEVAYIRFASVYQDFQNVDAFLQHIDKMRKQ